MPGLDWRGSIPPSLNDKLVKCRQRSLAAVSSGLLSFAIQKGDETAARSASTGAESRYHEQVRAASAITAPEGWMLDGPGKHLDESESPLFQQSRACMHMVREGVLALCAAMAVSSKQREEAHIRDSLRLIFAGLLHEENAFATCSDIRVTFSGPNSAKVQAGEASNIFFVIIQAMDLFKDFPNEGDRGAYKMNSDTAQWELTMLYGMVVLQGGDASLAVSMLLPCAAMLEASLPCMPPDGISQFQQTIAHVHAKIATCYVHSGAHQQAREELTKAISFFDDFPFRCKRALLRFANMSLARDRRLMRTDFLKVVEEAHPDDDELVAAYFGLAILCATPDGQTGSVSEGRVFASKGEESIARQNYLMGPDSRCNATAGGRGQMVALGRSMYGAGMDPMEMFATEVMQGGALQDSSLRAAVQAALQEGVPKARGNCAKCGVPADDSVKVSFCSACKSVAYCSKDCQRNDWKAHKGACKAIRQAREEIAQNQARISQT